MSSPQEQVQAVAWFTEFKSATHLQRKWGATSLELRNEMDERWMERGNSMTCSPRSLDVIKLDFFLKGIREKHRLPFFNC
ncbi:hypothetical protein TNCV_3342641 [Trichonephila clavipes]|nr:hypothetical protein TNCV_3342641 [Trichonephila clavipes]